MDSQAPLSRISILGVPVDILPEEGIEDLVARFADGKNHQIILLSLWDLMRARRSGEFRTMVSGASLVLPISLSIVKGARFLRRAEPVRYMPFDFVVKLLAALEQKGEIRLPPRRHEDQRPEGGVQRQVDLPGPPSGRALCGALYQADGRRHRRGGQKGDALSPPRGLRSPRPREVDTPEPRPLQLGHLSLVLGSLRSLRGKAIQAFEDSIQARPRVDVLLAAQAMEALSIVYIYMV